MFELDKNKIFKISGSLNNCQTYETVYEQLRRCCLINEIDIKDYSEVFDCLYLGDGVAILLLNRKYSKFAVKKDFKIFYFSDNFEPLKSENVHIVLFFASITPFHFRHLRRISEIIFNFGSDSFLNKERSIEDICCWIRGEYLVKNYITIVDNEIRIFKSGDLSEGINKIKNFYSDSFHETQSIANQLFISTNVCCNVCFLNNRYSSVLIPAIVETSDSRIIVFSVIAGKDMLYSPLINTLSIVASFDNDFLCNVSRETLLKNLEMLPLKITDEDRERITKLNNPDNKNDEWHEIVIEILNEHGLHARPAVVFTKIARMFKCPVWVRKEDDKNLVNAKDFMQILTMGVKCGDKIVICSTGKTSLNALNIIKEASENLFSTDFYQKIIDKLSLKPDD